jgi:Tol biopolymer transport system component
MTRSGSYYYSTRPVTVPKVTIVTLDSNTALRQGDLPSTGVMGSAPTWSPDGKRVAVRNSIGGLSIYSVDNTTEIRYALPEGSTMPAAAMGRVWSHDGKFILLRLQDRAGASLYQFSVSGGEFRRVGTDLSSGTLVLSRDDRTVYGLVRGDVSTSPARRIDRIVAVDLTSGKPTPISTVPDASSSALILSPDGTTLYLKSACAVDWRCGSITAVDLTNGQRRELFAVEDAETIVVSGEFALSVDGRRLALITQQQAGPGKIVSNLLRIGVDGEDRRILQSTNGSLAARAWNPDGSAVIALAGRQLVRIPIAGGTAEGILTIPSDQDTFNLVVNYGSIPDTISISPDGSHVALHVPVVSGGELWALDNVASYLKTAR